MPSKRTPHPVAHYGYKQRDFGRYYPARGSSGGSDLENMMGSKYRGTNSKDVDLGTKYDDSDSTPYSWLEFLVTCYRLSLICVAIVQLVRYQEMWDGVWHTLFVIQFAVDGFLAFLTGMAVYKNYSVRYNNATLNGTKPITLDEKGAVIYSNPDELHNLPEIHQGFFYMLAVVGSEAAIEWAVFMWWDSNKPRPLDCVDQRRLDRNMWLIILASAVWSAEPLQWFFNILVYMVRQGPCAGKRAQLMYDL
jgi:hypothetical protein